MKTNILSVALLSLAFASCGDAMSVSDYNAKVIGIYNPIDQRIADLEIVTDGADPSQAVADLEGCAKSVDSGLAEIQKLKVPEKAAAMHRSLVTLMTYERDTMLPVFKKVILAQSDPAALEPVQAELASMSERSVVLTNTMQAEQQKLAASVGAKVE